MSLSMERLMCVLSIASSGLCTYLFFAFATAGKLKLPGSDVYTRSPLYVANKYNVDNDPSQGMVSIAWPITLLSNLLASICLYKICKTRNIFPPVFYFTWSAGSILSGVWTFTFDRELHLISAVLVGMICVFAPIQLYTGVKTYHKKQQDMSDKLKWGLERVVFDSLGIMMTWTFTAMTSTLTYAIAYQYSYHLEKPVLRAWPGRDVAVAAGTLLYAGAQLLWIAYDMIIYPKYTSCLRSVYPMTSFCSLGLFFSNYDSGNGMNYHNLAYLVLGLNATFFFFLRNKLKGKVQNTAISYENKKID
ncbi:uncharacterized protein LOC100180631 [Ciona intestinalis]